MQILILRKVHHVHIYTPDLGLKLWIWARQWLCVLDFTRYLSETPHFVAGLEEEMILLSLIGLLAARLGFAGQPCVPRDLGVVAVSFQRLVQGWPIIGNPNADSACASTVALFRVVSSQQPRLIMTAAGITLLL
jgi:hypothetical protein